MRYNWDNLTAEQYQRLIGLGEEPKVEDLVWAMTGKTKNQMTVKEVRNFKLGDLTPRLDPITHKFFTVNGTTYAKQSMTDLPFGLFVDLAKEGENLKENLLTVVSYLYRPVVNINRWSRFKLNLVINLARYVRGKWLLEKLYKLVQNIDMEIEEYDPLKCDLRIKDIKKAPASVAHNVTTFFLTLSKESQKITRKSLLKMMQEMESQMENQITSKEDKQRQT